MVEGCQVGVLYYCTIVLLYSAVQWSSVTTQGSSSPIEKRTLYPGTFRAGNLTSLSCLGAVNSELKSARTSLWDIVNNTVVNLVKNSVVNSVKSSLENSPGSWAVSYKINLADKSSLHLSNALIRKPSRQPSRDLTREFNSKLIIELIRQAITKLGRTLTSELRYELINPILDKRISFLCGPVSVTLRWLPFDYETGCTGIWSKTYLHKQQH